jgi:VanZ family protein
MAATRIKGRLRLAEERLGWLAGAVALILAAVAVPQIVPQGWDKAAHFVAFCALTLCLWRATAGGMPLLVLAAAIALAALDEWRQAYLPGRMADAADFLVDVAAVTATLAALLMQRKTTVCAESSPR